MNSAFVLSAYFAMVLSPCFVATYGDLLSFRWMVLLAQRRRAHRAERFAVSFHHARYSMAMIREAAFVAMGEELLEAPQPFLVAKHVIPMDSPAFVEARQRIAARIAQIAVAQKLRNAAAAEEKEKVAARRAEVAAASKDAFPQVVPMPAFANSAPAASSVLHGVPAWEYAYASAAVASSPYWSWEDIEPPLREVAATPVAASSPPRSWQVTESAPQPAARTQPGDSSAFEIAA